MPGTRWAREGITKSGAESGIIVQCLEWKWSDRSLAVSTGLPGFSHYVATGAPAVQGVRAQGTRKD
jgi:hypothetical protein